MLPDVPLGWHLSAGHGHGSTPRTGAACVTHEGRGHSLLTGEVNGPTDVGLEQRLYIGELNSQAEEPTCHTVMHTQRKVHEVKTQEWVDAILHKGPSRCTQRNIVPSSMSAASTCSRPSTRGHRIWVGQSQAKRHRTIHSHTSTWPDAAQPHWH